MWNTTVAKHVDKKAKVTIPLEKHVANMRQYFVQERLQVPALHAKVEKLQEDIDSLNKRHEIRKRKDIENEIQTIREEIDVRLNMKREHEYETMIAPYMAAYNKRVEVDDVGVRPRNIAAPGCSQKRETIDMYVQKSDATATRQKTILNEYLTEVGQDPPNMSLNTKDECPLCKSELMLMNAKAIMTCKTCGYSVAYLDATMQSMSYNDDVEFSTFSYKRINHFNEWLQQVQAKENLEISPDVMEMVMKELYRQRVTDVSQITLKRVRDVLKTLKLRKAYEHVAQITSRLTGERPMRLTSEAEEQCRLMFIAVQPAFEKHCPKDRKNFLSYAYCLYKFFQLLGFDDMLESFTLLKGRDKLARQDEIFRLICNELDWEFIPSV